MNTKIWVQEIWKKNQSQARFFTGLLVRLSLACLQNDDLELAKAISEDALKGFDQTPSPFEVESGKLVSIIKTNSFQIQLPSEIFQFEYQNIDPLQKWEILNAQTSGTQIAATFFKDKIIAIGEAQEIQNAFENYIKGNISRAPIQDGDLSFENSAVHSILRQGLIKSFANTLQLETDEATMVWSINHYHDVTCLGVKHRAHEAAIITIRRYGNSNYLLVKPTLKIFDINGQTAGEEHDKEAKRLLLTKQYNQQFSLTLDEWRKTFCSEDSTTYYLPFNSSKNPYKISKVPAYGGIHTQSKSTTNGLNFPSNHVKFHGFKIPEPNLLFLDKSGNFQTEDPFQLKGLVTNRPFDYSLTKSGLNHEVRLGIICPKTDSPQLESYLLNLHRKFTATSKDQYLVDYPGFTSALGANLDIPSAGNLRWQYCSEPDRSLGPQDGSAILFEKIRTSIDALMAAHSPQVILIFIPERWKKFEKYVIERESFDLHNHIKAYCVRKGIATQLLRQATMSKQYQCEVMWWLALSLYVKSLRSPWVLEGLDNSTAYVGLGFGYDKTKPRDSRIVLGCSHIYDSTGQGLRYRLSKVDTPIWKNRKPHLSIEDARKLGSTIRQMYFESSMQLPKRVVIHKNTPFLKEERQGLIEGLGKIESIDMLELSIDSNFRGIASKYYNGKFQPDMFPIRRGTILKVESKKAYLWVHGSTEGINQGKTYYLGKSRIPAPIMIKRHFGHTPLSTIAFEILGLSKMNWNSFDLYNILPATLESSTEIAKIGSLLEGFGPSSYDYRLFI